MKKRSLVTALAAGAAFTFLGASSAVASDYDYKITTLGHIFFPGGSIEYTKYGDKVKVCDTDADGKAAMGRVIRLTGTTVYTLRAGGKGNCTTRDANDGGVFNLVEGWTYRFSVCLATDSGDEGYCNSEKWVNNG
ncbi:hypothetical protein ABZT26_00830 [Streptomyces sp. NPDC005395]|uniref:hypothetical protein n=1 Tax=unclassified Streptomyces TaxID=2593676 RepID=UPI0033B15F24